MTKIGLAAAAIVVMALVLPLTACGTGQEPLGSSGLPTPSASGSISTRDESGRPFDAVSGTFEGLTENGDLRVNTAEGRINVRIVGQDALQRGTQVILPDDLRPGEKVDAIGEISNGVLLASSVAAGTRSIDGTVISVESERLLLEDFYSSTEVEVYTDSRTQVIDEADNASPWRPGAVRPGTQIYATGYVDAAGRFILERIWPADEG